MQDLRVIGVENGALLVADDEGARYKVEVDDVTQSKLRQFVPETLSGQRLAPRDIQAYIRSGMSAEDVATITGSPLEHIQRFEGPVLAERDFMVQSALGVPVHTALEVDPMAQGATFGSVIEDRLSDLAASGERWASWKDATAGWIVKLSFTANEIDHDARWRFDPKKLALDPMNNEAVTLSQQGESTGVLIPRLRAVHADEREENRFDSGAFDLDRNDGTDTSGRRQAARMNDTVLLASTQPLPDQPAEMNQTADLLEALRRRRGEREAALYSELPIDDFDETPSYSGPSLTHPSTGSIRTIDVPLDMKSVESEAAVNAAPPHASTRQTGPQPRAGRKGRSAMPSWDEIVFGARGDDDLA